MNLSRLQARITKNIIMSTNLFNQNNFWKWKASIEGSGKTHILDTQHIQQTAQTLLDILPSWQTYRGVGNCNYVTELPISLRNIRDAYDQIRNYDLLNFNQVPRKPLETIWHELGRVKEPSSMRNTNGSYFIIAVCKPLMFLWGQTPPLDSKNRQEIRQDLIPYPPIATNRPSINNVPRTGRWEFSSWYGLMLTLQQRLLANNNTMQFCRQEINKSFPANSQIPWGRFLDIYYY